MITVVGLLGVPSKRLRAAAAAADWVVAPARQLDGLGVPEPRRITLGALRPAVRRLVELPASSDILVLASGDPGFFGVVRSLRAAGLRPAVCTAPSSIGTAFAAVGLSWDDAVVVSVHGRPLGPALNLARAHSRVAVLTSPENGVRALANGLRDLKRWFVLAERLGEPDERVRVLTGDEACRVEPVDPNVVLILADHPADAEPAWPGQIAGPVRAPRPTVSAPAAVAFARLLPEPGELLLAGGPLARDVAALARWSGAAVVRESEGTVGPAGPHVILTDDPTWFVGSPRAIVLTGAMRVPAIEGYRWSHEQVGGHHLATGVPA